MKFIILFCIAVKLVSSEKYNFNAELNKPWLEFQKIYSKKYENEKESQIRRSIWESNLKYINKHNLEQSLGHHSFTLKMNKYGDMTNEEFVRTMNGVKMSGNTFEYTYYKKPEDLKIPDSVDWRTKGLIIFELFIKNLVSRLK